MGSVPHPSLSLLAAVPLLCPGSSNVQTRRLHPPTLRPCAAVNAGYLAAHSSWQILSAADVKATHLPASAHAMHTSAQQTLTGVLMSGCNAVL